MINLWISSTNDGDITIAIEDDAALGIYPIAAIPLTPLLNKRTAHIRCTADTRDVHITWVNEELKMGKLFEGPKL